MSESADTLSIANDTLLATLSVPQNQDLNVNSITRKTQTKPRFEQLKFSKELTKQIIAASKEEATTVHGMICAAFIIAARRLSEELSNRPVTLLTSASCRKALGLTDECGVYVTTKPSTFEENNNPSFWDLARNAKQSIQGMGSLENISTDTKQINQFFFDKDVLAAEALAEMMFQYDFLISNIGIIPFESNYGTFSIESIYGPALLFKTFGENNIGAATMNGSLHLTQISRGHMNGLLHAVHEVLNEAVHSNAICTSLSPETNV